MKISHFPFPTRSGNILLGLALTTSILVLPDRLSAAGEQQFSSPEAAVDALKTAVVAQDTNALHAIFGPAGHELVAADIVEATNERELFASRLAEKTVLVRDSDSKAVLHLGADGWAFPIPLRKQDGQWLFDTEAGKEEILNRRIGANELGAIQVCQAYVQAQREYASVDRNGDEVLAYAQRLRSTPGTHDGLYWASEAGDEQSPLGPLIAQARVEGYQHKTKILADDKAPYHGYYFKILTKQGKHAPGGKYDYVIHDRLIGGFALVAWPAQWGNSGVMTFMVNQQGKIYQKNLGPKTSSIANGITTYDPDASWTLVKD
ncbi:MAG: DUF2950 domain-containing protein [Verrucomicrobiota bacterium]|jgi:hypothetical protein